MPLKIPFDLIGPAEDAPEVIDIGIMFRELNGKDNAKFLLLDAGGREMLSLERSVDGKKMCIRDRWWIMMRYRRKQPPISPSLKSAVFWTRTATI